MSSNGRTRSYLFFIIEQEHEPSSHHLIKVKIPITSAGLGPCLGHICDFDVGCLSHGNTLISGSLPNLRLNRPPTPDSNTYLGHPDVRPIWEELNRRACVVFIHPTHPVDTTPVKPRAPQPIIDYPHETTRTAYDMLTQGTCLKYPACKVILSHAGGALPYLISRPTGLVRKMPDAVAKDHIGATYDEMMVGFQSFYYDLALSVSPAVLKLLLENVPHDHILYGSDFPYAPPPAYPAFLEDLENSTMTSELRDKINFSNAINLIPRLSKPLGMQP